MSIYISWTSVWIKSPNICLNVSGISIGLWQDVTKLPIGPLTYDNAKRQLTTMSECSTLAYLPPRWIPAHWACWFHSLSRRESWSGAAEGSCSIRGWCEPHWTWSSEASPGPWHPVYWGSKQTAWRGHPTAHQIVSPKALPSKGFQLPLVKC